jgi:hypothetical protein
MEREEGVCQKPIHISQGRKYSESAYAMFRRSALRRFAVRPKDAYEEGRIVYWSLLKAFWKSDDIVLNETAQTDTRVGVTSENEELRPMNISKFDTRNVAPKCDILPTVLSLKVEE